MARTLLYDPGMVGLPSVFLRTPKARVRVRPVGAPGAPRPHALAGSNDGWLLMVVVEVKPRLCIYTEQPTSAPNQSFQEEFRMARTLLVVSLQVVEERHPG